MAHCDDCKNDPVRMAEWDRLYDIEQKKSDQSQAAYEKMLAGRQKQLGLTGPTIVFAERSPSTNSKETVMDDS